VDGLSLVSESRNQVEYNESIMYDDTMLRLTIT